MELLVVLALLTAVLLLSMAVEGAVLRRLRAEEAHLTRGEMELALARMRRDIREASGAQLLVPEEGSTGRVLLLREAVAGEDAAYVVDGEGRLLRAVSGDPAGGGEGRVLLDGVVWHEFQLVSSMRLVVVSLRRSDGSYREVTCGIRSRPGTGWGGVGQGRGGRP